jgi:hypothetical protein
MDGLASSWTTNGTAFQFTGARKIFPPAKHAFDKVQTASRYYYILVSKQFLALRFPEKSFT